MSLKKIKKKFYHQEKIRLQKKIFRIRVIVNDVLQENFNRRLYNLKHDDELRLLTLYVWRDRYKVSIRWILKLLIPIWSKKFSRFKIKTALGCRVATLVGKKSEEIIRERLWKEFPNDENKSSWRQHEKDRIISSVANNSKVTERNASRYKNIFDAPTPEKFIRQYRKEIKWKRSDKILPKHQSRILKQVQQKQFRMNPWVE